MPVYGSYASLLIRATDQRRPKKLFGLRSTSAHSQRKCFFPLSANLRKIQFMREANRLKAPLKPTWASFMIQTRQELGSYTALVKQCLPN